MHWRMNAAVLPLRPTSRSGPIVPVARASASEWQPLHPDVPVNSARPAATRPRDPADDGSSGPARRFTHAANAAGVTTLTELRMKAWPMPHSSAQTIGYVPRRSGVARRWVVIPGTTSSLAAKLGTQKEWITSCERIENRTDRPIGSSSVVVVSGAPPVTLGGYTNCQANCWATTPTSSCFGDPRAGAASMSCRTT